GGAGHHAAACRRGGAAARRGAARLARVAAVDTADRRRTAGCRFRGEPVAQAVRLTARFVAAATFACHAGAVDNARRSDIAARASIAQQHMPWLAGAPGASAPRGRTPITAEQATTP